ANQRAERRARVGGAGQRPGDGARRVESQGRWWHAARDAPSDAFAAGAEFLFQRTPRCGDFSGRYSGRFFSGPWIVAPLTRSASGETGTGGGSGRTSSVLLS